MKKFLLAALLLVCVPATQAQSVYGEVGYSAMSTRLSVPVIGLAASAKPAMVRGLVGVSPLGGLSIEGIVAGNLNDDPFRSQGSGGAGSGQAKVKQILGAYVGTRFDLGAVELFGRAGMAKTEVSFSGLGSGDDTGFSYGGGVRLVPGDTFTLSADYMNYLNKGGVRVEGYTLSLGLRF